MRTGCQTEHPVKVSVTAHQYSSPTCCPMRPCRRAQHGCTNNSVFAGQASRFCHFSNGEPCSVGALLITLSHWCSVVAGLQTRSSIPRLSCSFLSTASQTHRAVRLRHNRQPSRGNCSHFYACPHTTTAWDTSTYRHWHCWLTRGCLLLNQKLLLVVWCQW